jgi:hypothetical protein
MLHAAGPHQISQELHLMPPSKPAGGDAATPTAVPLTAIAEAVAKLRFGAVVLTVHDGKLVQMDVTERQRFS